MFGKRLKTLLTLLVTGIAAMHAQAQYNCLIEAEAFQFKGKWVAEKSSECLGTAMLRVYTEPNTKASDDALTAINIPAEGKYDVWVRSRDYVGSVRPRTFTLSIGDVAMAECGRHGREGFYWEKVGSVALTAGQTMLRLHDSGTYYGRCDAIFITTNQAANPNSMTNTQLAAWRKQPVTLSYSSEGIQKLSPDIDIKPGYTVMATASGNDIRLSVVKTADGDIVCKTDFRAEGSWRRFGSTSQDCRVAVLANSNNPSYNHNQFYPAWSSCQAQHTIQFSGNTYPVSIDSDRTNPYNSGKLIEARPVAVTKTGANTLKITYDCGDIGSMVGIFTVPVDGHHINVSLTLTPASSGNYSMILHAVKGIDEAAVTSVMLPPMFQYRRIPTSPVVMLSSMMTQCIAAVETTQSYGSITAFATADLDSFSQDWGSYDFSEMGLTLRNSLGQVQPVAIAPVQGSQSTVTKAGRALAARFVMGVYPGDCAQTLQYVSDEIFKVTDYRQQTSQSLTSTVQNVKALLTDDSANGWDHAKKGPWDIECNGETTPTIVHASPLAVIGASMLTDDEEMYRMFALPTIEYMLGRNSMRTVTNAPSPITPLQSQFPTSAYQGIHLLSGNLNPWLSEIALPNGQLRPFAGYFSTIEPYSQALAAAAITGDDSWLDQARALASTRLQQIAHPDNTPVAPGTFYNSKICNNWRSLLDLYEATGDYTYIEVAEREATNTIAGIKTWPRVGQGTMQIHPGGKYDGITTIWWRGAEQFRLGFPRVDGDAPEHRVDAWKVSPVGLSIEQPATYFQRATGKNVHPVFMSQWAPDLLRLADFTGNPIYRTYARNAVIGRADNYPGYYATGYTDITTSAQFPYKGPDVSSIYYHHIPGYLAMLQDFLVTETMARSDGEISFPHATQEGFVWFSNNIYGRAEGLVYGQKARLWMPRNIVTVDSPEVNTLTARGDDQLYIMLTNESSQPASTRLTLSPNALSMLTSSDAIIYHTDGSATSHVLEAGHLDITIPAMGLATVACDINESMPAVTPLAEGFKTIETSTPAGNIYLYRIRSPFGWDSVYGVAGCTEVTGLTIEVKCNGRQSTASTWPYEWSFDDIGYNQDIDLDITIKLNGSTLTTVSETFDNSSASIDNIITDHNKNSRSGIYTIDGRRIDSINRSGFYIINGQKVVKILN